MTSPSKYRVYKASWENVAGTYEIHKRYELVIEPPLRHEEVDEFFVLKSDHDSALAEKEKQLEDANHLLKHMRQLIYDIAPSWLPEEIRKRRRDILMFEQIETLNKGKAK